MKMIERNGKSMIFGKAPRQTVHVHRQQMLKRKFVLQTYLAAVAWLALLVASVVIANRVM